MTKRVEKAQPAVRGVILGFVGRGESLWTVGEGTLAGRSDPIMNICGISAGQMLDRIAVRRYELEHGVSAGQPLAVRSGFANLALADSPHVWGFLDFSMPDDSEFVRQVHAGLLGRPPAPGEFDRRMRDIMHGATRLEIVLRIMLSPEGRRRRQPVRGGVLRSMSMLGRILDHVRPQSALSGEAPIMVEYLPAAGTPPPSARMGQLRNTYRLVRKIPLIGVVAECIVDLTHLRRLRYELIDLRTEVARLRAAQRA